MVQKVADTILKNIIIGSHRIMKNNQQNVKTNQN